MWESRVLRRAFERLELHEGKLSRAVLRGGGGGDVTSLPDPGWGTTQVYPARNSLGLHPLLGTKPTRRMGGQAQDGEGPTQASAGRAGGVVPGEPAPADWRSTPEAHAEAGRPLRLLWDHR